MIGNIFFWIGLAVATIVGVAYFRDLGDVSQMILRVKRENMIRFIRHEYHLLAIGIGGIVLMVATHLGLDAGPPWLFWTSLIVLAVLYVFPYVWVHVGLRNQMNTAKFYSIAEAQPYVSPSSTVLVLEKNGVARAHPDHELLRPIWLEIRRG